jgi:hypothetical protein
MPLAGEGVASTDLILRPHLKITGMPHCVRGSRQAFLTYGSMRIIYTSCPLNENESGGEEESMMEQKNNDLSGLSQTSVGVFDSGEGQQTVHRRLAGLTITVENIDRVLTDIQAQIEFLRRERTNLGLVRRQLAAMEASWRGE